MKRAASPLLLRDRAALLELADQALSAPPAKPWIRRPVPAGSRVARFVLPLELCQASNRTGRVAGAQPWARKRDKDRVFLAMRAQCLPWEKPLQGRPQVLCVRFSRAQSDQYADWAKAAVDVLCAPRGSSTARRLGIIVDDRPSEADVHQWCEPVPKGAPAGFVVIDVWSGDDDATSLDAARQQCRIGDKPTKGRTPRSVVAQSRGPTPKESDLP
jgi:hypothetical protein